MTSNRVIVINRRKGLKTLYHGPFVSETLAQQFINRYIPADEQFEAETRNLERKPY